MARKHVLELLLSEHYGECYSCVRNGNCELQTLAEEYGITEFPFGHPEEPLFEPDYSSYSVMRDMNKCIRCRRCVRTCIDLQEVGVLEAVGRSNKVTIETFEDMPLGDVVCINCGQCVNRCPTGALYAKDETDAVWAAIDDPDEARRHPDRPGAALGHGRAVRPRAGHAGHLRDEHRPAPRRLRQGVRHQLHRRPHHHRGRHRAHPAPLQGARAGRQGAWPCRSSRAARRAGSSTSSTSTPSTCPTPRAPRARSRCSARSSRPTTPRSSGSTRRTS